MRMSTRPLPALLLAALLGLAGCAGSQPGGASYLLPSTAPERQFERRLAIQVAPVRLAGHLDSEGIVMQLNDIEVYQARQHLWAEDIAGQLQRVLQERLGRALPRAQVVGRGQPLLEGAPVRDLRVQVSRFQGRFDGVALAEGQWQLLDGNGRLLAQAAFSAEQPLADDGYPALVRALGAAWEQVADQLAAELGEAP
ncbi:membrane integrity-associated transporter subunit PqiC [Zobellella sp. CGMCC 1.18722]|uniref:Membrane integrity-associated transporter subunit PqiC n=2 Tax=Zobellella iuensis TaxID=2803811 RepID=A0ABS1QR83_9GAMM|nr:membrane integrity-associated transporter subunit PqiC [Zobellella iuensis]